MQFLNNSLKGGKINEFTKALLFIRQSCMEQNMKIDYQSWYSATFGSSSNFKTSYNATFFKFLLSTLTKLIPFEPKLYLKIHINQALSAPPKCNSLVHDYKDLCRARLQELRESPSILMHGVDITVLHLIEESAQNKRLNPIMLSIIHNQQEDFYNAIVPQILKNKMPFSKVKELLLENNLLTGEVMSNSVADVDGQIFDDEDDDLILIG